MTDYIGKDRVDECCCTGGSEEFCRLLQELRSMSDRINAAIVSVQGIRGDGQGNVQLRYSEDINDSTMGISGTFAGGPALIQVLEQADDAVSDAADALTAAGTANSNSAAAVATANSALTKAQEALEATESVGVAVSFDNTARRLVVTVGTTSDDVIIPGGGSGGLTPEQQALLNGSLASLEVRPDASDVGIVTFDNGGQVNEVNLLPVSDTIAGVLTPAQMREITDSIDSHALDNAVVHLAGAETVPGDKNFTGSAWVRDQPATSGDYNAANTRFVKAVTGPLEMRIQALEDIPDANGVDF